MNTLRNRLLLSFGAILLIMLLLVGLMLLVFLRTRPLPTDEIVQDLTATLLDVRVSESWQINAEVDIRRWRQTGEAIPYAVVEQNITAYLDEQASARDVRTLVVRENGAVEYDSAGIYQRGEPLPQADQKPLVQPRAAPAMVTQTVQGEFIDADGTEWLFVAQPLFPFANMIQFGLNIIPTPPGQGQGRGKMMDSNAAPTLLVMVARPVPQPTLREVFRVFGDEFLAPLARAGLVGLLVAFGLSALIARSVARPLQQMSRATERLARGDFRGQVPVRGPYEVRALAASFNEMVARVAVSQQAHRDFLANVSHDLRTPLTSIQGFSQAIAEGVTSDPAAARRAAQIIHAEAARMHRMVEDLLDMARIEAGRMDMLRHAVQIGDLLRGVSDSLSVKARDQGVMLETDLPPGLPRIAGDGDRLAQVFTNLLDNAIKHTPSGGRVSLRAETGPDSVLITISDTGEGIPPTDLSRIFERFYQVDKSRQRKRRSGVGLGLAITQQIIEAHGGTIQVASKVGEGTTFTVWLPRPSPDMSTVLTLRSRGR